MFQKSRNEQDVCFGFLCKHPQYITLRKTVTVDVKFIGRELCDVALKLDVKNRPGIATLHCSNTNT